MKKNFNRQSYRLKGYDYSSPGYYFVTINVKPRLPHFGEIRNGYVYHTRLGRAAEQCWREIPNHFPHTEIDEYIIMPDHVHGIIRIVEQVGTNENGIAGAQNFAPLQYVHNTNTGATNKIPRRCLGSIVRGFKIGVKKWANNNGFPHFKWQRNYHDWVVRTESDLNRIRQYIRNNPKFH